MDWSGLTNLRIDVHTFTEQSTCTCTYAYWTIDTWTCTYAYRTIDTCACTYADRTIYVYMYVRLLNNRHVHVHTLTEQCTCASAYWTIDVYVVHMLTEQSTGICTYVNWTRPGSPRNINYKSGLNYFISKITVIIVLKGIRKFEK